MANLPERLKALAETLDGCEWNHPLGSAEDCRQAAEKIKSLLEAAMTVYERTITPEPCTCPQCVALAELWKVMQQAKEA